MESNSATLYEPGTTTGNIDADLLIIGAGYTGLSCALHSIDSIKNIIVIDQAQPGCGCSGRNGGQINPHGSRP